MPPGSSVPVTIVATTTNTREEVSHAGPPSRDLFLDTFLCEHVQGPEEGLSMIDL